MAKGIITRVSLPVTVKNKNGEFFTETFSAEYRGRIRDGVLKEFGFAFEEYTTKPTPKSRDRVATANRELLGICKFLCDTEACKEIKTLASIKPRTLKDYVDSLQREFPTHHTPKKTHHPWYRKWTALRPILKTILGDEHIPYIEDPGANKTDGHTPYAMGMMLDALREEIDSMRNKLHIRDDGTRVLTWEFLAEQGKPVDHDWIDEMTPGKTSQFTKKELDYLEKVFFEQKTLVEIAEELDLKYSYLYTLRARWLALGRKEGRKEAGKARQKPRILLTDESLDYVEECLFDKQKPTPEEIASKFGVTGHAIKRRIYDWRKAGREAGRPQPVGGKGKTSQLTSSQLDDLESYIFEPEQFIPSYQEIADKLGLKRQTFSKIAREWKSAGREEGRPESAETDEINRPSILTKEQLDRLEKFFFDEEERPTDSEVAKKLGVTSAIISSFKKRWKDGGRKKGRPKAKFDKNINLTTADLIATIKHYIPDFPFSGRLGAKNYRVYETPRGILKKTFTDEKAAQEYAKDNGWHIVTDLNRDGDDRMNPAERLLASHRRARNNDKGSLALKMRELLPDGPNGLVEKFFPTSYDMTIVYLFWLCLTGWNTEAIRTVRRFDLFRQIKAGGNHEILSKEHATFAVEILEEKNDAIVVGEKNRSQPEGQPKLYTHISDRDEEYGLFRVLEDYYWLIEQIKHLLSTVPANRILVGIGRNDGGITFIAEKHENCVRPYDSNVPLFFKRHEIYEDEERSQRIHTTTAKQLRVTYFTTLRSLDIPITTLVFLAGHESVDTHLVHYSSGQYGTTIRREQARKHLNTLATKIFTGKLTPYRQIKKKSKSNVLNIWTHRESDIMLCENNRKPTWPDNEKYFERDKTGLTKVPCDKLGMCLLCEQCRVTEDTLPYLVKWKSDIRNWRKAHGGANFGQFMFMQYRAINEVFDLCKAADGNYWKDKLREAQALAKSDDFDAPHLGGSL